jgi:hypothetical protein
MQSSPDSPELKGCPSGPASNSNQNTDNTQHSRTPRSLNIRLFSTIVAGFALLNVGVNFANAATTTMVDLGAASPYAVLSGASVGNTVSAPGAPHTTIRGDLGIKADTAPTGFPPGVVIGTIRHGSSVDQAHANAVTAYNEIAARPAGVVIPGALVGAVLVPGLYKIAGAASNTGTLTLDGGGDPNAVFVFQVDGALSFAALSRVVLTNGARASRVFWQVNGAGSIGAGSDFVGTMIASAAVGMGNGTFVNGRAIALAGALTLDNNQFYGAPPVITIDGGDPAYTTDTTPTIFGTTDLDAPGQVTVTIAGQTLTATPVNGIWTVTAAILANGTYAVEASGSDAAGNPASATQQLTVDTAPPQITLDGGATVITNQPAATIGGTTDVAANTVVRVTIDSQALNALVQGDGAWNIRAASLADGTYDVAAFVSDPAGNESTATQSITIDTTAPSVAIAGGPNASATDPTPTVGGFANVPPGTTVTVIVANQTLTSLVDANQLWSVTAATLPDGVYRFIVTVTDAAGNQTQAEHLLTINAASPPVTVAAVSPAITRLAISPKNVPLSGDLASSLNKLGPKIRLSVTQTAAIRFEITRPSFKTKTFRIQSAAGASIIRLPKQIRKSLPLGSYRLTATATNPTGQTSAPRRASFKVIP